MLAFPVAFFGIFGLAVASFVCWIVALVEVVTIPDSQFRAAGTEKLIWVLVVALTGVVGALVWLFAMRHRVRASRGAIPAPPPGWYPEGAQGAVRWWDGKRWTAYRHAPPGNGP